MQKIATRPPKLSLSMLKNRERSMHAPHHYKEPGREKVEPAEGIIQGWYVSVAQLGKGISEKHVMKACFHWELPWLGTRNPWGKTGITIKKTFRVRIRGGVAGQKDRRKGYTEGKRPNSWWHVAGGPRRMRGKSRKGIILGEYVLRQDTPCRKGKQKSCGRTGPSLAARGR